MAEFDYVVVGAGSVLANRLTGRGSGLRGAGAGGRRGGAATGRAGSEVVGIHAGHSGGLGLPDRAGDEQPVTVPVSRRENPGYEAEFERFAAGTAANTSCTRAASTPPTCSSPSGRAKAAWTRPTGRPFHFSIGQERRSL